MLFTALQSAHPDAHCELDHHSPFQLLVATILSAQTTDKAVNAATPLLFHRWPDAEALAAAPVAEVEETLRHLGMYRQKAARIVRTAQLIVTHHAREVPRTLEALTALPGVGRKTANVVLGVAYGTPEGIVVDTHVQRLAQRLGLSQAVTPEAIERDLMELLPRDQWDPISHLLIFQGRRICAAQRPLCASCSLAPLCPSAGAAEGVGRKPRRTRS